MLKQAIRLLLVCTAAAVGEECTSHYDCRRVWFAKQCCQQSGTTGKCYTHCYDGDYVSPDDVSSNAVMQGFQYGTSGKESSCVAQTFDANEMKTIENQIASAFRYGNVRAIYSSYQSIITVAKQFSGAEKQCESKWIKFWFGVEKVVKDIVNIAHYICQYKEEIMEGTAIVGMEEAEPIEAAIIGVACASEYFDEALHVIKAIDDGISCAELAFGVKQFIDYSKQQTSFNYEIGKFSGEVFRYGKACVQFPEQVIDAAEGAKSIIQGDDSVVDGAKSGIASDSESLIQTPKRQLVSSTTTPSPPTPLSNHTECQFCLSEVEIVSFFQGIYDGQRYLDPSLPQIYVQECILLTNDLKNFYTGQLQSKLTGLMLAYEFRNTNETIKMMYELDDLSYRVITNSSCDELNSIALFKTIEDRYSLQSDDGTICFNTTEDLKIDLSSTTQLISINNKKLQIAQATNSTVDQAEYLHNIGEQFGMAAKIYQMKGKTIPSVKKNEWQTPMFLTGVIGSLVFVIVLVVIIVMKKKATKHAATNVEENQTLTINSQE